MNEQLRQRLLAEYSEWHQQLLGLNVAEIQNPQTVVVPFFDFYSVQQIRVCLKYWLDDAINNNHAELNNHVTLYDNVEKLVEAAWLIHQNNLQKDNKNKEKADEGTKNRKLAVISTAKPITSTRRGKSVFPKRSLR